MNLWLVAVNLTVVDTLNNIIWLWWNKNIQNSITRYPVIKKDRNPGILSNKDRKRLSI